MSTKTASKTYRKLHKRPNPVKNPGPPNRKARARLALRLKDYAQTTNTRKDSSGFHKPGSMQGPR